jgi:small-conductance mechanosensitive channel
LRHKLVEISREEKLIKHKVAKKTSKLITESSKYKLIENKRQAEYKTHEVKFKLLATQIEKERWNLSENQKMIHYWESKIEDLQNKSKCMGDDDVTIRNLIHQQTEEANRHILQLKSVRKVYNSKLSILREKISLDRRVMVDYKKYMVAKFKSEETHFSQLVKEEKLDITETFKAIEVIKKKLATEKDPAERTREHRQIESLQIHIEHEKKEENTTSPSSPTSRPWRRRSNMTSR